jgi:putative membrane protein
MVRLLVHWVLSALSLLLVANFVKGFKLSGFGSALMAALVIGLVNGTLGLFLKIATFPLSLITLGLFLLVINALMIKFASIFVPGFKVEGFAAAFWGALALSILNLLVRWVLSSSSSSGAEQAF